MISSSRRGSLALASVRRDPLPLPARLRAELAGPPGRRVLPGSPCGTTGTPLPGPRAAPLRSGALSSRRNNSGRHLPRDPGGPLGRLQIMRMNGLREWSHDADQRDSIRGLVALVTIAAGSRSSVTATIPRQAVRQSRPSPPAPRRRRTSRPRPPRRRSGGGLASRCPRGDDGAAANDDGRACPRAARRPGACPQIADADGLPCRDLRSSDSRHLDRVDRRADRLEPTLGSGSLTGRSMLRPAGAARARLA